MLNKFCEMLANVGNAAHLVHKKKASPETELA